MTLDCAWRVLPRVCGCGQRSVPSGPWASWARGRCEKCRGSASATPRSRSRCVEYTGHARELPRVRPPLTWGKAPPSREARQEQTTFTCCRASVPACRRETKRLRTGCASALRCPARCICLCGHVPRAYRDCLTDCYSLSDNTVRPGET